MSFLSIVAVKSSHKLSGLKKHECIILQLCRSEVRHKFCWAKIKVLARRNFFRNYHLEQVGCSREESAPFLTSPAFRSGLHFLAHGPRLPSSKPAMWPLSGSDTIVTSFSLTTVGKGSLLSKTRVIRFGPPRESPHLKVLNLVIPSESHIFTIAVTYSKPPDLGCGHLWGRGIVLPVIY